MPNIKDYFISTRPMFFPAIILPVIMGSTLAWHDGFSPDFPALVLTLIAGVFYHGGMNAANDYFDAVSGADDLNKTHLSPFTGGSRVIQEGRMKSGEVLALALALIFLGSIIGLYLAYAKGPALLVIGAAGLFTGFFYSAPPIAFMSRGLGELMVGLNFGVFATTGAYFTQTGVVSAEAAAASLPLAFLIAAILYVNEFPDFEADRSAGKRTLVVRLSPRRARWGLAGLFAAAYGFVVIGVAAGYLNTMSLLAIPSGGFAAAASVGLIKNYDSPARLLLPVKQTVAAHFLAGVVLAAAPLF